MVMNLYLIHSLYMIICGMFMFSSKRKHLLVVLLSLEFMILILFYFLYMFMNFFGFDFYFMMIFLTLGVCEGSLGLSILVSMIRTHGNDYFQTFSLLQC
uniref:NADH-ubiquinone oxidoreductase chain 4L n=1 Tax=Timema californicum TaxID=61474 RepID=Q2Q1H3_TIMCA|nr:NADH dehydrogenase subunit 4L [Timema californicum]